MVRSRCVPLLQQALRECMDHDHEVAHASLLALGRVLGRTHVPRQEVMPEVRFTLYASFCLRVGQAW